ncbi:MAG: hypothetical protein R6V77_06230 [Candidatus Cloacimonadaceae bacterium]
MLRTLIIVLIVLWLCLLAIAGVNFQRQYQLGKQNMRILKDYELKSAVDEVFKVFHDSVDKDIALAEQAKTDIDQSFPLKDQKLNWLLLRLAMIVLTVLTVLTYWLYYRKLTKD